jgi:metal-responsive CopG/Arc/MetJ family transcriptional regulator
MYNRMDRVVTLKISADLLEQLDAYAIRNGMNRSEAVRKAIEKLLKDEEKRTTTQMRVEKFRLF